MTPVIALANLAVTLLNQQIGKTFVRRYSPNFEVEQVKDGLWFVMSTSDMTDTKAADVDITKLEIDVCYQRALPEPTTQYKIPYENLPFIDECMDEVESVKKLFREGGAFRVIETNGFSPLYTFLSMSASPLYSQEALLDWGLFISGIRLKFFANLEDEDLQS